MHQTTGINPHVAVPLWVAIETLQFGELLRLCHLLKDCDMKNVLNDFNLKPTDRTIFLNMLDVFCELRNHLAHGNLAIRFCTPAKIKFTPALITTFNLSPTSAGSPSNNTRSAYASKIKLYDALKMLKHFESIKPVIKEFKKYFYKNHKYMTNASLYNSRVLEAIKAPSYQALKDLT